MMALKRVIEEKRKNQKLVKASCADLAGFKPRTEPPHPHFEEIRLNGFAKRQTNETGDLTHRVKIRSCFPSQGKISSEECFKGTRE